MSDVLLELSRTIRARHEAAGAESYTRKLLEGGPERCAKKFGEEAVETVIAAVTEQPEALRREAADLLYHLLVLLESRDVEFESVLETLRQRFGTSGLAEKAARETDRS